MAEIEEPPEVLRGPKENRQQRRAKKSTAASSRSRDFDADKEARALRESKVTIGGQVFHPRLRDGHVSEEIERIGWEQERCNAEIAALRNEIDDLEPAELDERDELVARIKTLKGEAAAKTIDTVRLMLTDDDGNEPAADLFDDMPEQVITRLTLHLLAGGEPLAGPTETSGS